jgi:hypothetical protein
MGRPAKHQPILKIQRISFFKLKLKADYLLGMQKEKNRELEYLEDLSNELELADEDDLVK